MKVRPIKWEGRTAGKGGALGKKEGAISVRQLQPAAWEEGATQREEASTLDARMRKAR